nr:hypothetical protein [Variovorax paradoxus]
MRVFIREMQLVEHSSRLCARGFRAQVRIDRRGGLVGVAEQLGHLGQAHAGLEQARGEGMAEGVRRDAALLVFVLIQAAGVDVGLDAAGGVTTRCVDTLGERAAPEFREDIGRQDAHFGQALAASLEHLQRPLGQGPD